MKTVGATFGESTPSEAEAIITDGSIGLFDFITARNVLTQIKKLKVESNISKEDARNIAMGEDKDKNHDVLAVLDVIGYVNGEVNNNLQPIMPGTRLETATTKQISDFLGFTDEMLPVGELLRREDVKVMIDKIWMTKHISIMGMTGTGKSNLAKIILDALSGWYNNTIIMIDPHGEYDGDKISVDDIQPDTKLVDFESVIERLSAVIGKSDKGLRYLLTVAKTSSTVKKKKLKGLDALVEVCDDYYGNGASGYKPYVLDAIKTETINAVIQKKIINHKSKVPLVIDLRGVNYQMGQGIVCMIAELVLELGKSGRSIMTFIDEIQLFCPQRKKALSKDAIINLISEGRKFGCGVVIMSQRPAKVDKDIISQCSTKFCLRVTNDNDIRQVRSSTEYATRDMFKEVQKLDVGQALLSSPWLKRPVFITVDEYVEGGN